MTLKPKLRKALLVTHVVSSVGWLGADFVLLLLGVAGLGTLGGTIGARPEVVYPAAGLICTLLVAPLCVLAWLVGVLFSLTTKWGLVRYWWVVVKLTTTTVMMVLVLVLLTPGVRELAAAAENGTLSEQDRGTLLIGPTVSTVLLVVNIVLSVYKPWGRLR